MTQEEKAKAYDEALEKAMKYDPDLVGLSAGEILEDIFPELVESEDEKIRKEIINYLEPQGDCCGNKERWIAWLEKQGEKKPQRMVSAEAKEAMYDRPKQELTEFEKALQLICNELGVSYSCKAAFKSDAKELLSIARKQIASEIDVDAMVSDTIICENLAYYRQGIEDTLKTIKGE